MTYKGSTTGVLQFIEKYSYFISKQHFVFKVFNRFIICTNFPLPFAKPVGIILQGFRVVHFNEAKHAAFKIVVLFTASIKASIKQSKQPKIEEL